MLRATRRSRSCDYRAGLVEIDAVEQAVGVSVGTEVQQGEVAGELEHCGEIGRYRGRPAAAVGTSGPAFATSAIRWRRSR